MIYVFYSEGSNVMKISNCAAPGLLIVALGMIGCSKSSDAPPAAASKTTDASKAPAEAAHTHGAGPNGGIVFEVGSRHAEFTVDHPKHECKFVFLGDDEKTPAAVAAAEFILIIQETKTADGTAVPSMTVAMLPVDAADGKASTFVGTDPGIGNVADFAGVVTGEIDGKPISGNFDEAAGGGHGEGHAHTPHDGVIAALKGESGEEVGFVELKLHDDKGDLELWLGKDREMKQPIDLPANAEINVSFKDLPGKVAALAVRDNQNNEDEEGNANLRDGMTNYFIFPGDSGQDPSWLIGKDFRSAVQISISANGVDYESEEFVLVPHTHADGHAH
jgi:hypothetical protein